jgi:uncharacterized protein
MLTVDEIIRRLGLVPLQGEGGYYAETYRAAGQIPPSALSAGYEGAGRQFSSAIYYLLTNQADSFSALHRLRGDEVYHFYLGDPVDMLLLDPDGSSRQIVLGQNLELGQMVQFCVPAGVWQGSSLLPGGQFALMGTTMAPAFDFRDFEAGRRGELIRTYPAMRERIERLTRQG